MTSRKTEAMASLGKGPLADAVSRRWIWASRPGTKASTFPPLAVALSFSA